MVFGARTKELRVMEQRQYEIGGGGSEDQAKRGQEEHLRPHQPLQSRYLSQNYVSLPSQSDSSYMTKKQLDVDVPRTVMFKEGVSGPTPNDIVSFLFYQPEHLFALRASSREDVTYHSGSTPFA